MMSRTLLSCAGVIAVLTGCGGDDSKKTSQPATQSTPNAATQPAKTTTAADGGGLPASGARKLTAGQKSALLAKNNEIALGGYDPSANGPKIAANFRAYAGPLAAGPCKQALSDSATNWIQLGQADSAGDAAKLKQLGQKTLANSTAVFNAC